MHHVLQPHYGRAETLTGFKVKGPSNKVQLATCSTSPACHCPCPHVMASAATRSCVPCCTQPSIQISTTLPRAAVTPPAPSIKALPCLWHALGCGHNFAIHTLALPCLLPDKLFCFCILFHPLQRAHGRTTEQKHGSASIQNSNAAAHHADAAYQDLPSEAERHKAYRARKRTEATAGNASPPSIKAVPCL